MEGSETGQSFEAFGEVVSIEEGGEMLTQLRVIEVVVGADSRFLDGAVHALDLTRWSKGDWVWSGGGRCHDQRRPVQRREHGKVHHVAGPVGCPWRGTGISWGGEVGAVVGENGVDLVGDRSNQLA